MERDMGDEERWRLRFFLGFIGLLLVLSFPGLVLGSQTLVYRDFGLYSYPVAQHVRESWLGGEAPLWNPWNNCGIPFVAQWSTLALYPFSVFNWMLPLSWALPVFGLLHLLWGGVGMYCLANRWTENRYAGCVAGLGFALNGFMLNCLMWPHYTVALGWMPWVVYSVERAWREGGKWIFLAALAGGMQMVAGPPEVILITWGWVAAFWMGAVIRDRKNGWRATVRVAGVILLVAGLGAAQIFPFLEFLPYSQRQGRPGIEEWSLPGTGWGHFLVPMLHVHETPEGVYYPHRQGFTSSYYLGIGILFFAVYACLWRRRRLVWMLAGGTILSLILALGSKGYLYDWAKALVPAIGMMRYPAKFVIPVVFAAPLLAGVGIQAFMGEEKGRVRGRVLGLGAVFLGLIVGLVVLGHLYRIDNAPWEKTAWNGFWRGAFLIALLGLLLGRDPVFREKRLFWGVAVLVLLWLDIRTHMPAQNPTSDPSIYAEGYFEENAGRRPPELGEGRIMLGSEVFHQMREQTLSDPAKNFIARRLIGAENANLLDKVPKVGGFYSLYLARERAVASRLITRDKPPPEGLLDFLGVTLTNGIENVFSWSERPGYLPMITAGQEPVFASEEEVRSRLREGNFRPGQRVYLPLEAEGQTEVARGGGVEILGKEVGAHRIVARLRVSEPGWVVISQYDYPAWKAYIDGEETKIWDANWAFQAVAVGVGEQTLVLRYEDKAFRYGSLVSLAALGGCVAGLGYGRLKGKKKT